MKLIIRFLTHIACLFLLHAFSGLMRTTYMIFWAYDMSTKEVGKHCQSTMDDNAISAQSKFHITGDRNDILWKPHQVPNAN